MELMVMVAGGPPSLELFDRIAYFAFGIDSLRPDIGGLSLRMA
jgi:hypothetical protein